MPMINFVGINNTALARGRSFLETLIPGGKFRSLEYQVRNPTRDDKRPGSFSINYRTGIWKDFATDDGGSDLISLWAYVKGVGQGEAARELAGKLGMPTENLRAGTSIPTPQPATSFTNSVAPKVCSWGDAGPPRSENEARRHTYKANGVPVRIKIKFKGGNYNNWYRLFDDGRPRGWQAKKPDDFQPVPYVTAALDPFHPDLRHYQICGRREKRMLTPSAT
jgi:hypothetical protein